MKYILFLSLFLSFHSFSQSKIETFCLENGLEVVNEKESYITVKHTTMEQATMFPATYEYTFEATFILTDKSIKLASVRNTKTSNNGFLLDLTTYRGGLKENITKKSWQKLVDSVNKNCQDMIDKYNSYINL